MKLATFALAFFLCANSYSQVGIGTATPEGELDVTTTNDLGIVLPRVSSVENVTNGNGGNPVDGTLVFDTSLGMPCVYTNAKWVCFGFDGGGNPTLFDGTSNSFEENQLYVKASNTGSSDQFGNNVVFSDDGLTLAIAAPNEGSIANGINGDQANNSAVDAGAVYLFINNAGTWSQQAYIKASNTNPGDFFGRSIALSASGDTLVVGASQEDSNATTINGNQFDNSATGAGAAYVFTRSGTTWTQAAYLKATNAGAGDNFGQNVAISDDGQTVVVGAPREDSGATGVNGNSTDNSRTNSGAAYVFVQAAGVWSQQAYIKASNTGTGDLFTTDLAVDGSGDVLVISSKDEDSSATGIGGDQADNSASSSGAAYVFSRSGTTWTQIEYLKASNSEALDEFGTSVSISQDGITIAVTAPGEDSSAIGINGNQGDNAASVSGSAYVFVNTGGIWSQQAYVKASNTASGDNFGYCGVALSSDGSVLVVGAVSEDSSSTGVNGDQTNNTASDSGAAYVYFRSGTTWSFNSYMKATNAQSGDSFAGYTLAGYNTISLSADGSWLAIGAITEDSSATGVGGDQNNNSTLDSGAVYIYQN
jgi:FG-GAP repeat